MENKGEVGVISEIHNLGLFVYILLVDCLHISASDCRTRMEDVRC